MASQCISENNPTLCSEKFGDSKALLTSPQVDCAAETCIVLDKHQLKL